MPNLEKALCSENTPTNFIDEKVHKIGYQRVGTIGNIVLFCFDDDKNLIIIKTRNS